MAHHSPSGGDCAPARPAPIVPPALYWPSWTDQPVEKLDLNRFDDFGHLKYHARPKAAATGDLARRGGR